MVALGAVPQVATGGNASTILDVRTASLWFRLRYKNQLTSHRSHLAQLVDYSHQG